MEKLLKVMAPDCPVCQELAGGDAWIADREGLELEIVSLEDLAALPVGDVLRDYVVGHHVNLDDGMIDIPVYLIMNEDGPQASGVIKTEEELENLIKAWEAYKSRVSVVSPTT